MEKEKLSGLKIGDYELEVPIIQGGMSIKVGNSDLVEAVADYGAMGTLGGVGIGYGVEEYQKFSRQDADRLALRDELQKLKKGTKGVYGVNLLTAMTDYDNLVKIAAENEAKVIVSGAGLPLHLPLLTRDYPDVALIPIVSSARALGIICERWYSTSGRLPDAFIIEAPSTAGGHLGATPRKGFTMEQRIYDEDLKLKNVIKEIKDYFEKHNIKIPLIAAGGSWDRSDVDYMLGLGFDGVQVATPFVCTTECNVSIEFKEKYIGSTEETIVDFLSPLGLYGRAIRTKFLDDLTNETLQDKENTHCTNCLSHCSKRVCLADALDRAYKGDVENGIVFAGSTAYRCKEQRIVPARKVLDRLTGK